MQIKLTILISLPLSLLLVAVTPLIFGIENLDSLASSYVLERFISLSGIILLTSLFVPEQDKAMAELVESKVTSILTVYLIRFILSLILLFVVTCLAVILLYFNSCEFNLTMFITGTFTTAFFLGSIGFMAYGLFNNVVTGYLLSLGYYMFNFFSGKSLKNLYLFSLSNNSLIEKYWLFVVGAFFVIITFSYKKIIMKLR